MNDLKGVKVDKENILKLFGDDLNFMLFIIKKLLYKEGFYNILNVAEDYFEIMMNINLSYFYSVDMEINIICFCDYNDVIYIMIVYIINIIKLSVIGSFHILMVRNLRNKLENITVIVIVAGLNNPTPIKL